jgi:hypothetical protein
MRKNSTSFRKTFFVLFLFTTFCNITKAQTTLAVGDIAFTGYVANAVGTETFSFVLLVPITTGTVINFTDNGWNGTALTTTEQSCTWTSGSALAAGKEITITGTSAGAATAAVFGGGTSGTVTGLLPSLATSGDQLIAYQGTLASPTIITGIHMNVYSTDLGQCANTTAAAWDPTCIVQNANSSRIPPTLTTGTNAVWIGTAGVGASEQDNAVFANLTGAPLTTAAQVRAAVNNPANWTSSSIAPPTITLPSGANFFGVLPVTLVSFTGKLNANKTATLQWEVADQLNMKEYIVERSADGNTFKEIGTVQANNYTSFTYNYIDNTLQAGTNYYRLKTLEVTGKATYSNVFLITIKSGSNIDISLFPNPVVGKLTIRQLGVFKTKTALLCNAQGITLKIINITTQDETVNMQPYPAGVYLLKVDDGTVYKLLKQNE